jgi:hypothetical protein
VLTCALSTRHDARRHRSDVRWVLERDAYLCRRCREELGVEEEPTKEEESGAES